MADELVIKGQDQFPILYGIEPRPFQLGGQPSGAAGAVAKLSFALPSNVHFLYGMRISNYYPLPNSADAAAVARFEACRRWLDDDQSLVLDVAQQSVFVNAVKQNQVMGTNGIHWHPFPVPYRVQGSNNWGITVTRLTGYPDIAGAPVLPVCAIVLVAGVFKGEMATEPQRRVGWAG